ncbi:uncharacterized protein LACBIDRAFT_300133 [Laccaria bicolor S238N-H82]|uniref:Predicted protein n=1 Tax=Laccaria bicolor (strain S238N-H82 / ATCC MYA-4686) TaxID=486041 RepID=B0DG34_LACBS|nr:uncharacterized protein LACBIDRAFT_300133 [Laccaria bicolor S238N-H82]EDR06573.1 predicted protein [Laccaria bicolor S238N-H82]|eukprot:XP_001882945.1 predicted protein [Laccaria bicolor S238N-H82]
MVNGNLRYPFLLRPVSASHCTLLAGCGMSGLQSMALKATSLGPPLAQWSNILRLYTGWCLLLHTRLARTSKSSTISTHRGDFIQRVTDRDGICLITGVTENFQACHILPHAKGSQK